jgi:hypothetical protein
MFNQRKAVSTTESVRGAQIERIMTRMKSSIHIRERNSFKGFRGKTGHPSEKHPNQTGGNYTRGFPVTQIKKHHFLFDKKMADSP